MKGPSYWYFWCHTFAFLYLCCLTFALRPREVNNPFPDLPKFTFDYEYMIFILSRLSNFNNISKVTYLLLPLISLCFLPLQQPQIFMFIAENSPSVNFSSHVNFPFYNAFQVEQPWWIEGFVTLSSRFIFIITSL